jgi:NADH-quinone oxidoreductase subunit L
VLDRGVSGIGRGATWIGERLRPLQGGGVQTYALFILLSVLVIGMIVGAQYTFIVLALVALFSIAAAAVGGRL